MINFQLNCWSKCNTIPSFRWVTFCFPKEFQARLDKGAGKCLPFRARPMILQWSSTLPILLTEAPCLIICFQYPIWFSLDTPGSLLTRLDFTSARTVLLLTGSYWWLKVWCNSYALPVTSFFPSAISSHASSSIWTLALIFAISRATFNLSV